MNAQATNTYQTAIREALSLADGRQSPTFLLVAHGDIEYEPVFALTTSIRRADASARIHVVAADPSSTPAIGVLSQFGAERRGLLSLEDLANDGPDVCLFINSEPSPLAYCMNVPSARVDARAM